MTPSSATSCVKCNLEFATDALFCPQCGTAKSRDFDGDPLLGTVVGERFLIQERIGHGASGSIYKAEHVTLRRKVAVKVLHYELSRDDLAMERFRREATTVSEIDNEHIVEIHDFGRTQDGRLYLAMELLEGETLDKVLEREKQLPVDKVVDVIIQLAEALMEAHAIGYIHRDLRPRNIYLAQRRNKANFVKLLDFGLAKLVESEGEAASTSLGMTFGEPKYMSPEQARGDGVDRRGDIYSLGCIAYEMLIGEPPFVGQRVFDILTQHVETPPVPPASRREDIPAWLNSAVMRMLAKRAEDRFTTVYRLVEALRQGLKTGETMSDRQARKRWTVPPPSVSREMKKFGLDPEKAHEYDPRKTVPAGLVGSGSAPEFGPAAAPAQEPSAPVEAEAPAGPRRRTASPTPPPDSERRRRDLAAREMLPQPDEPADDYDDYDDEDEEDEDDLRKTVKREVDPAKLRANTSPSGKGKPASPDSSSGISAAWFADGEADDEEDELDDGYKRKLAKARANVSPSASHTEDIYFDPARGPGKKIALAAIGVVVIALIAFLAWPGGDGSKKKTDETAAGAGGEDEANPAATQPDAGPSTLAASGGGTGDNNPGGEGPTNGAGNNDDGKTGDNGKTSDDGKASDKPKPKKRNGTSRPKPPKTKPPKPKPPKPKPPNPKPPTNPQNDADKAKADFYAKLGQRALRQGDIGNAAINFNKARQLNKNNADAYVGLGEIALGQGSYGAAIGHLRRASRMRSGSSRVHTLLGEAYLGAGRNKSAQKSFEKALRINPGNSRARNGYNEATKKVEPPPE